MYIVSLQLRREIDELTNGEYTLLSEYKTMNDKVLIRHNVCGSIYEVTPHNFLDSGNRCPFCTTSHGELYINKYLSDTNSNYDTQKEFDGLIGLGGGNLKYDFVIYSDKEGIKVQYLIEYDGEFHFYPIMGKKQFNKQQEHDKRKDKYCIDKNIKLIRIPFWDFDNINTILDDILIKNNTDSKYIINNNKYDIVLDMLKTIEI